MKKILILFLLLAGIMPGFAQRSYKLGVVVVRAKRPLNEIGVTKTTFDSAMLDDNLQRFGLTGHERYKNLSLGNKHKSMIAYALSLRTPFLLFDEPANGLDIAARHQMRQIGRAHV